MSSWPVIDGLIDYMKDTKVPHRYTSTYRPAATTSHHSRGRAVDFAGPHPSEDSEELRRVYLALLPLWPQCTELVYSGPGGGYWKNGRPAGPYAVEGHHNHVHIAMPAEWRYERKKETPPMIPEDKKLIAAFPYQDGYVLVSADGSVYCFNCTYQGGMLWNGQAWVVR